MSNLSVGRDDVTVGQELSYIKNDSSCISVSVVIPVYNSSKYLEECLESALGQTLNSIEVICVDDGSTDDSLEILRKYEKLDKRVKVIVQANSGQSVARNRAVREAQGEFVYFLDSDDLIEINAMEELYEVAKANNLDTLFFDGTSFYETKELEEKFPGYKTYYKRNKDYKGVYNGRNIYSIMRECGDFKVTPGMHFMKRTNILEHNIWYPEGIMHEDNYFAFLNLMSSNRVMCVKKTYYLRRVRNNSIMTKEISNENIIGYYVCSKKILEYLKNHKLEDEVVLNASTQIYRQMNNVNEMIRDIDNEDQLEELAADVRMGKLDYSLFLPSLYISTKVVDKRVLNAERLITGKQKEELKELKNDLLLIKDVVRKQNVEKSIMERQKEELRELRKDLTCLKDMIVEQNAERDIFEKQQREELKKERFLLEKMINNTIQEQNVEKSVIEKKQKEALRKDLSVFKNTINEQKIGLEKLRKTIIDNENKKLTRKLKRAVKVVKRKIKTCIRCFKNGGVKKVVAVIIKKAINKDIA